MGSPNYTSIKVHQGNRLLIHTKPYGISPLPPSPISFSKAVCQNMLCGTTKADNCTCPRPELCTQMHEVNNADLRHSKNLRTHVYFQNLSSGSAKEEKVLMKSKWALETRNKWTDCYVAWGKYCCFPHLIQCHVSLWFSDLCLSFLNYILSKFRYHREQ